MNNNYEDFASFATHLISTLTTISGHLKGIVSHKNTQYYMLYVYISIDFSLPLAAWVAIFVLGHHYKESTTILSDI